MTRAVIMMAYHNLILAGFVALQSSFRHWRLEFAQAECVALEFSHGTIAQPFGEIVSMSHSVATRRSSDDTMEALSICVWPIDEEEWCMVPNTLREMRYGKGSRQVAASSRAARLPKV